jgi:predicted ABC-type transport system involved in lysophospholipase L1 biosynthesis ATPase subunit
MTATNEPVLLVENVVKDHQGLRPLRIKSLSIAAGEIVSIGGIDAGAAEVFVNLITGASLPASGEVSLFGQNTRAIPDGASWLASLEGLAMISTRGVLIEMFTPLQNIAMPFTLDVDPIDPHFIPQAGALARSAGLDPARLDLPVRKLAPIDQMRTHVARALALKPRLVIAEHPTATLPRDGVSVFAADLSRAARSGGASLLVLTADDEFAKALGGRRLLLQPATGELKQPGMMSWLGLR